MIRAQRTLWNEPQFVHLVPISISTLTPGLMCENLLVKCFFCLFVLWCGEILNVQLLIEFSIAQLALGQAWHIESVPPERLSISNPDPSLTVDISLECL